MMIFVRMNKRVGGRAQAALGWGFDFWIDVCKTKITVCDTVELAPMLKLVIDLVKENLISQMGRVSFSKKSELTFIIRVHGIYRAQLSEFSYNE